MNKPQSEAVMTKRLYRVREAAEYLGLNKKKVYELVRSGELPFLKSGIVWLLDRHDLDSFVERNKATW